MNQQKITTLTCPPCSKDTGVSRPVGKLGVTYQCAVCTTEWSDGLLMPGRMSALFARWLHRRESRQREDDHFDLDRIAGRMLGDYRQAVAGGAAGEELAQILTGIAGCELAMSRTNPAMGWGGEPDEDGGTVGESARSSGLLVLEIAAATSLGALNCYSGPPAPPFADEPEVVAALRDFAVTHSGAGLDQLWRAVVEVIGGQAAEVLVPLMVAHGHTPSREERDRGDQVPEGQADGAT